MFERTKLLQIVLISLPLQFLARLSISNHPCNKMSQILLLNIFFLIIMWSFTSHKLHNISKQRLTLLEFLLHLKQTLIRIYLSRMRIDIKSCEFRIDKMRRKLISCKLSTISQYHSIIFDYILYILSRICKYL